MWESTQRISLFKTEERQWYTPKRGVKVQGSPSVRSTPERGDLNHLYRMVLPGLCFSLANILFYFSRLTGLEPSPICMHIFWSRWIPEQGSWMESGLIMDWPPPSLSDPWESFCTCVIGPRNDWSVILSFYSCRAQLWPLTFSLMCQKETRPNLLKSQLVSSQGPIYLLPHYERTDKVPWGKGVETSARKGWGRDHKFQLYMSAHYLEWKE